MARGSGTPEDGATEPDPAGHNGSGETFFASGSIQVRVQRNRIELKAPCQSLSFSGDWGAVPMQLPRFYRWVDSPSASGPAQPLVSAEGTALTLTLLNQQAQPLLGPVLLPRQPAAPASASC